MRLRGRVRQHHRISLQSYLAQRQLHYSSREQHPSFYNITPVADMTRGSYVTVIRGKSRAGGTRPRSNSPRKPEP